MVYIATYKSRVHGQALFHAGRYRLQYKRPHSKARTLLQAITPRAENGLPTRDSPL